MNDPLEPAASSIVMAQNQTRIRRSAAKTHQDATSAHSGDTENAFKLTRYLIHDLVKSLPLFLIQPTLLPLKEER